MGRIPQIALLVLTACGKRTTDEELSAVQSDLEARLAALEQGMVERDAEIESLNAEIATLVDLIGTKADAEPLAWLDTLHTVLYTVDNGNGTVSVYVDSADLVVTSANLYVQSGLGSSGEASNGLGNVIIGYDESSGAEVKTGSHNLVIGPYHSYASMAGVVAGYQNAIEGPYAVVLGGEQNQASGAQALVLGGVGNVATGDDALVAGGQGGVASGLASTVLGGENNEASGTNAATVAGSSNTASGSWAVVTGGTQNEASGDKATVGGGYDNDAQAEAASVSCGSRVENDEAATCAP